MIIKISVKVTSYSLNIYKKSCHLESKETFLGKIVGVFWARFCVSVLFNNYFPFSIKIPVKYNTVLLFVSKAAKIPWFRKALKDVFLKNQHWKLILKCTTMQIEKVLKNDCYCISKVPWKFYIPTVCNLAVIYTWNLLFS